jgi:hypothetical protein
MGCLARRHHPSDRTLDLDPTANAAGIQELVAETNSKHYLGMECQMCRSSSGAAGGLERKLFFLDLFTPSFWAIQWPLEPLFLWLASRRSLESSYG